MKLLLMAAALSYSITGFSGTFNAKVDDTMCGEIDPFVIGDACILQLTQENGKRLGLVFDFDDFMNRFTEYELNGKRVKIDDRFISKITESDVIRELQDYSSDYFYMTADIEAISRLQTNEMDTFVSLMNGHFNTRKIPHGYKVTKLPKLVAEGGLKRFIDEQTKEKLSDWNEYVMTSENYEDLSAAQRANIAADPYSRLDTDELLKIDEVFAIYKGNKVIGYFLELNDFVQAQIYEDGAWIEMFIDADFNVLTTEEHSG
jgi:hypothetical protein